MINFSIAFDNQNEKLGNYFLASKVDIINFIEENALEHNILEIHSTICNQAYIDIKIPQVNESNFIFIAYSHGGCNCLTSGGQVYIQAEVNSFIFTNSFFYSMACHTAVTLGNDLISIGCHAFIGYNQQAAALTGKYQQVCIECDNYGMKMFLSGHSINESYRLMKENFSKQVDKLEEEGQPLRAAYLASNRDALKLFGNGSLKKEDFVRIIN